MPVCCLPHVRPLSTAQARDAIARCKTERQTAEMIARQPLLPLEAAFQTLQAKHAPSERQLLSVHIDKASGCCLPARPPACLPI